MTQWVSGILVAIAVILLLLYAPKEGVQGVVVVLSLAGLWEYFNITNGGEPLWIKACGLALGGGMTALLIFWAGSSDRFPALFAAALMATLVLHFFGSADFMVRFRHAAFFYFGVMYVSVLFSFWGKMRGLPEWRFWFFLMLAGTVLSDVGGYVVGRWIGRHKLAPRISPGKTIEGLIGGVVFTVSAGFVVRFLFLPDFSTAPLVIVCIAIAVIGPLGDLSESLIKRGFGVKDSGRLIPGHGGLLDRVDALLFTGPVVYYFAKYFS
ncbi:MAG: phosphatidate cytidylyltransferase [Deltaproteobacteria bacterium]|nr:phosphatidate cytidylyltransferase [Deltaproteobacteria bacterium]